MRDNVRSRSRNAIAKRNPDNKPESKWIRRKNNRLVKRTNGFLESIKNGHDGTRADRHKHHRPGSGKTRTN